MKNHLVGTHIQVKPCSQVPIDVKMKFQELLVAKKVNKDDDDDDDMVDIFKQQDVNPSTVEVLRLVDGDAKLAIGYIYEAMRRAKNQIAKNFNNVEHRYREIWKIIDTRWDFQLHRPLHAAAYYLNPKYHYDPNFNPDKEVKIGLYKVIEKMYPDVETRVEVDA
ncbi:hypothetical protein Pint_18504 [Pistacia integerrima]|uniref:Uncharacterized protein n=1 Tax=Pistacia integerrima TaxID=434235 RepID=A0ACC0YWE8_9ROSI|nr:hypothetical protein Pint_18504 [Pistacia integerrima]